jgi:starvation-inducible DNA-binding protein
MPKGRRVVLVEGVPSEDQIEEMLNGLGFVEEAEELEGDESATPGVEVAEQAEMAGESEDDEDDEGPAADEQEDDPDAEIGTVIEAMSVALASTFAMYLRAHVFHWNVVGPNFVADHKYLDELSGELFGAIDPLAEHLRALGGLAPSGIGEFAALSAVEDPGTPEAATPAIWEELLAANEAVVSTLQAAFDIGAEMDDQGLLNFLADRLDRHAKHGWFLRSLLGQVS